MQPTLIGRVAAINRYPVKSMQGQALQHARLTWHGLEGDRRYAFVRAEQRSHFPWLTARELPAMLRYRPAFADLTDPAGAPVLITTPAGDTLPIGSQALQAELAEQAGEPLHLLHLGRGAYDSSALSLISTAALDTLASVAGRPLPAARFRPNLLVEAAGDGPFPEDGWMGRLLVFGERPGSARVRVVRPIQRCAIITIDPDSTRRDPSILRAVAERHNTNAGVYAFPECEGTVAVGDAIWSA